MDQQTLIYIIVMLILALLCIIFFVFAIFKYKYNLKKSYEDDLRRSKENKVYEEFLTNFFESLGGVKNVIKVEHDENENRLHIYLRDINEIDELKLNLLNPINYEKVDNELFIYFEDSKKFYDSLFGK